MKVILASLIILLASCNQDNGFDSYCECADFEYNVRLEIESQTGYPVTTDLSQVDEYHIIEEINAKYSKERELCAKFYESEEKKLDNMTADEVIQSMHNTNAELNACESSRLQLEQ